MAFNLIIILIPDTHPPRPRSTKGHGTALSKRDLSAHENLYLTDPQCIYANKLRGGGAGTPVRYEIKTRPPPRSAIPHSEVGWAAMWWNRAPWVRARPLYRALATEGQSGDRTVPFGFKNVSEAFKARLGMMQ